MPTTNGQGQHETTAPFQQNLPPSSFTKDQKEGIALLQIGTFLEYFDLMLYVHMAVLLNELFFPKTDQHTAALLTAFAFCSTYILRPFGALVFGWIGDNIGRKATVIITTTMMAVSCILMANLPTYAQIGIAASWIVTVCRVIQGLSSMGEIIAAEIYVTEITKPPLQYPAVCFITLAASSGSVMALGVASLVTRFDFNWRIAFWVGACIAMIGSLARTRLRETPEFLASRALKLIKSNKGSIPKKGLPKKTFLAFFLSFCGWPLSFYLTFMYFSPILSHSFGYKPEDVILHNFYLVLIMLGLDILWTFLSYKIYPLKILKARGRLFIIFALLLPWIIPQCHSPAHFFVLQSICLVLSLATMPAQAILVSAVPVLKRLTTASFSYALSRAVIYVVTSFGLVALNKYFGYYGLLFIMLPIVTGYLWAVGHFEKIGETQLEAHKNN